jgi:hypothetical protein
MRMARQVWATTTNRRKNLDGKPPAKKPRYNGNNNPLEEDPFQWTMIPRQQWVPNHTMSFWDDEALHRMVTVVVALDGGINLKADVKVKVSDCGFYLIVRQKVVHLLGDVESLHSHFRKKDKSSYPAYHPKIVGFHKYLKAIRNEQEEEIYNIAQILLPFQVQTDVAMMHKFIDGTGVRLVYVDLRSKKKDDYIAALEPEATNLD